MTRREERESIVRIIFREAFFPPEGMEEQTDEYLKELVVEPEVLFPEMKGEPGEENLSYIREKTEDIHRHLPEIDPLLESASIEWKLNRIGKMELAILRVAAYEIRFDQEIPNKVAINEAIELTKKYCDQKAAPFINGVLNRLLPQEEQQEKKDTP